MNLLKQLIEIPSVTGQEYLMKDFLVNYFSENETLQKKVKLFYGEEFQDNLIVRIGDNPKVAIYVHQDIIGYTVRYDNEIIPFGSPIVTENTELIGEDSIGKIQCKLQTDADSKISCDFKRTIEPGTTLTHITDIKIDGDYITSPYLDNRAGIYTALKLAEQADNLIIAFTTFEEQGFGGAQLCGKFIYDKFSVQQALILDTAWISENTKFGNGTVISLRDRGIPRKKYVDKIRNILKDTKLNFQFEVEESGGSDGAALQSLPYPIDWCFVGPPIKFAHSPQETIKMSDISDTIEVYKKLLEKL